MNDYKDTLLMPKTNFEMWASLVEKDKVFQKKWIDIDLYNKILEKNKKNKSFILHDGPPYANGDLHVGHALDKIIKDIIIRQKSMLGFYAPYIPGWDTHGLPIENKMLEELNQQHKQFNILEIRKAAKKYALNQVSNQKEQFKSFSLLCDFKNYYLTLDSNYEARQLEIFKKMALDGLIFKALKPVYWSPSSQSALAEAEVIYMNHMSPSIYVALTIRKGNDLITTDAQLIIWTTTPWTLIANAGIAISPKMTYLLVNVNNKKYVVAKECLNRTKEMCNWNDVIIEKEFEGKELIGIEYICPIIKTNISFIVEGHHVTSDAGTGLVHIAPLFGEDDFIIGKKNNFNKIMHINDDGTLNDTVPEYNGMFYADVNKLIGLKLDKEGNLLSLKFVKHSYPHDWRTKKPIMYRATPQWFVSIESIKSKILNEIEKIDTKQDWVKKRMNLMISGRKDWCISRQRAWGVPIIIFYDSNKKAIINEEIFNYVIELIKTHGSNIWYEKSTNELLPPKYRNQNYTREKDIMDVWFDSGSSFHSVEIPNAKPPYDLYLEGSDQYRGWFNSSLIASVAFTGKSPYKQLVSHGFVLDGKNEKMSKSKGNVVDPLKIVNKFGSEILRLWVANSEYFNDITISDNIIKQNIEIYRKIRGTLRYMLGNLYDFNIKNDKPSDLDDLHLLILEKLNNLLYETKENYYNYNLNKIIKDVNSFLVFLSTFYFDVARDILYTSKKNSKERRSYQYVIFKITYAIIRILAPILPVTMDEAYSNFNMPNKEDSIHLTAFPTSYKSSYIYAKKWKPFFNLKKEVYKLIEKMKKEKIIKKSNEIKLFVNIKDEFLKTLDLKKLLLIGAIEHTNKPMSVSTFDSYKCARCWNYFEKKEMAFEICINCKAVIDLN